MNAAQRHAMTQRIVAAVALIDAQPVPTDNRMMYPDPHACVLCGEPLDGHHWCDRSTDGFHVRPLPNL